MTRCSDPDCPDCVAIDERNAEAHHRLTAAVGALRRQIFTRYEHVLTNPNDVEGNELFGFKINAWIWIFNQMGPERMTFGGRVGGLAQRAGGRAKLYWKPTRDAAWAPCWAPCNEYDFEFVNPREEEN